MRDIRSLETFVQIVDSGSLTAAAGALGQTLPMVSRDLVHLEGSIGTTLVRRTTRRISVTDEGLKFYRTARQILEHWQLGLEQVHPADERAAGTVRLVMLPWALHYGFSRAMSSLLERHPELHLKVAFEDENVDLVGDGWDIEVLYGMPPDSTHVLRYLARLEPRLAASVDYARAHPLPTDPSDLAGHECLRFLGALPQSGWTLLDEAGHQERFPIGGRLELGSSGALAQAIEAGLGIGLMPQRALQHGVEQGELVHVLPDWRVAQVPIAAIVPRRSIHLTRVRVVLDWLEDFFQSKL